MRPTLLMTDSAVPRAVSGDEFSCASRKALEPINHSITTAVPTYPKTTKECNVTQNVDLSSQRNVDQSLSTGKIGKYLVNEADFTNPMPVGTQTAVCGGRMHAEAQCAFSNSSRTAQNLPRPRLLPPPAENLLATHLPLQALITRRPLQTPSKLCATFQVRQHFRDQHLSHPQPTLPLPLRTTLPLPPRPTLPFPSAANITETDLVARSAAGVRVAPNDLHAAN
jgi:hypothetical protein